MLKFNTLFILLLISVGLFFQWPVLNDMPDLVHAWAQADRFAITLKYLDNGLDFFHPATFIYNKHFPGSGEILYDTSITAVNFPIHNYIIAILMKILETDAPWVFRGYSFIHSLLFLYFLFKVLVYSGTSKWTSATVTFFALLSPVFVYYQANYLPSVTSLSLTTCGIYYYLKFERELRQRLLYWSLFLLVISALTRTTFTIPLVAVFSMILFKLLRKEYPLSFVVAPVLSAISLFVVFFLWSMAIRGTYASMFVNTLLFARSWGEFKECISLSIENWGSKYFPSTFYIIWIGVFFLGSTLIIFSKQKIKKEFLLLLGVIGLQLFGCLLFIIAMTRQFPNHDYYFLDTFYLPLVLLFGITANQIKRFRFFGVNVVNVLLIALALVLFFETQKQIKVYRQSDYSSQTFMVNENFKASEALLNRNNVGKDQRVMVFNPFGPNIPFVHFKRDGVAIMKTTDPDFLKKIINWDMDYVLLQKSSFINQVYSTYPQIINQLRYIDEDEHLILCQKVPERQNSLGNLFSNYNNGTMLFEFKGASSHNLSGLNIQFDSLRNQSYHLQLPEEAFGLQYDGERWSELDNSEGNKISVFFRISASGPSEASLVLSIENESRDSVLDYQSQRMFREHHNITEPIEGIIQFSKPSFPIKNKRVSFYLYNPDGKKVKVYDLKVILH